MTGHWLTKKYVQLLFSPFQTIGVYFNFFNGDRKKIKQWLTSSVCSLVRLVDNDSTRNLKSIFYVELYQIESPAIQTDGFRGWKKIGFLLANNYKPFSCRKHYTETCISTVMDVVHEPEPWTAEIHTCRRDTVIFLPKQYYLLSLQIVFYSTEGLWS